MKTYTLYTQQDNKYTLRTEDDSLGDSDVAVYLQSVKWTECYRYGLRHALRTDTVVAFSEDHQNMDF